MAIFTDVYKYLEDFFPREDAEPWDQDGMDVCISPDAEIKKIILALDITSSVINYAKDEGANLIITHHPVLFDKINVIDASNTVGKKLVSLIKNDISAISYHTRLDKHQGGVNDSLCQKLGLTLEYKICNDIVNVCNVEETDFDVFAQNVKAFLNAEVRAYNNNGKVKKIAVCGGGGKSMISHIVKEGVDTYITGEVDHMALIDSAEYGINLILGTHYATEALVLPYLKSVIQEKFPQIPVLIKYTNEFSK